MIVGKMNRKDKKKKKNFLQALKNLKIFQTFFTIAVSNQLPYSSNWNV
jgi:hypothetical protein